ncbi:ferredoxin reductase [Streptomyces halobius]|uniref:Ferredoxin reductase n=1 Tax=Streptomyces halobius TaxID=2879846 RepID=A0ABY4M2S5_9ACTN|nr:ferredoxin reductase [Streptomyces halobius]UQA91988.1 ferredoxin reductase [Streptomyces halobius]
MLRPVAGLLTSPHSVDTYLELIHPAWTRSEVRAIVTRVEHPTAAAVTLTLRPNQAWRGHMPGQHVQLGVQIGGVRRARTFSIASSPDRPDGLLEITATCTGGRFTTYLRDKVRVGTVVALSTAQGQFVLPQHTPEGLLFICGGSGITPALSMVRTLVMRNRTEPVGLLHYSRSPDLQLYRRQTEALSKRHSALQLLTFFTRGQRATGSVHFSERHLNEIPGYAAREVFVSGPAELISAVTTHFNARHPRTRVHAECFQPATPTDRQSEGRWLVEFATSGRRAQSSGECLLDQAENMGLTPEYGCRQGICGRCIRPLIRGSVSDVAAGNTISEPGSPVRLCVCVPESDVVLDL